MSHPRDPFSSGDSAGEAFARPRSSPRPPTDGRPHPLPAPAAPPEAHHTEAIADSDSGSGAEPEGGSGAGGGGAGAGGEWLARADRGDEAGLDARVLFESWDPPSDLVAALWDVPVRSPGPG